MRMCGMKLNLLACLVLILAGTASATKIHLKNPWPGVTILGPVRVISSVIAGPPGALMTDDGDGWYSITIADNLAPNATFIFVMYPPAAYDATQPDYAAQQDFRMSGISKTGPEFVIGTIRAIAPDVWIIPQGGTKTPIVTEIPQAKKVAILFNPWPDNAPTAKIGNATTFTNMYMSTDPTRCGWYGAYFNAAPFTFSVKSLFGTDTYGVGGMNDSKPIDLTSYFATSDTVFLVPDPIPGGAPKILTSIPAGVVGTCSFPLAVTVRDFSIQHPDFEKPDMGSDVATLGLVNNALGPDGKPVRSAKAYNRMSDFVHWFTDDSTAAAPLTNYTTCSDLTMSKSNGGQWGYDSYKTSDSHSYFPIDDFNRFNETAASEYIDPADGIAYDDPVAGRKHNFAFCMEMHATFKYKTGQVFNFVGDDDVWAFIDKKLVMDLGGPHPPLAGNVQLDKLGLTAGAEYPFDFFFCERHTTGSDLTIQTSIFFEQQQSVFVKTTDLANGGKQYDVYERTSGSHSCQATTADQVVLAKSEFKLSGPSVNPAEVLSPGVTKYGGITVNTQQTQVKVDTSIVTGLRPGDYLITYTTTSGKGGTLPFHVSGNFAIEFSGKQVVNPILGTLVPVTVQATLGGVADKRAEPFLLSPPAGLSLFSDSSLTKPIAAGTVLTTDAATGTFKFYATSNTAGTYRLDLKGGPGNTVQMDNYNLSFHVQPKVLPPEATPGTSTFIVPIGVTLIPKTAGSTIFYTTDGTPPANTATGTTKQYAGAIPLSASTEIKAIAVLAGSIDSDILTVDYTYSKPVAIKKAWYLDLNGDGMIETVIIDFFDPLVITPDKLAFKLTDAAGKSLDRTAQKAEINFAAGSKSRVVVTLAAPFDKGVTSLTNSASSGQAFKQDNVPILDGNFPVEDSVPPVISKALVTEPDSGQPFKRVLISISEGVALGLDSASLILFKRDGVELAPGDVKVRKVEKTGDRDYAIYIDSTSDLFPIVGDSVSLNINGEVKDLAGVTPTRKNFIYLDGKIPTPKPLDLYVTFPNSKKDKPSDGLEPQGDAVFIPVDIRGNTLSGDALDGKCTGVCFPGSNENFVGPVFHIVTPGPITYEFKIFNNHGQFVTKGKGAITEKDLAQLPKTNDASGVKYLVRVVWTGRTQAGEKAATGAYILQTDMVSAKDPKTGAGPARDTKRVTFGLLRSFRGS